MPRDKMRRSGRRCAVGVAAVWILDKNPTSPMTIAGMKRYLEVSGG